MRAVDPRLLRHARAARGYLVVAVLLGLAVTGLIVAQAALLAHALAAAALGTGARALAVTLVLLLGVVVARSAAAYGGEAAALWAAARVKSQLRRRLTRHCLGLGPAWLGGQQPGGIAAAGRSPRTCSAPPRAAPSCSSPTNATGSTRSTRSWYSTAAGSPNKAATISSATRAGTTSGCGRANMKPLLARA